MHNPLKNILEPKFITGLEIDADSISAVEVLNSRKGLEITRLASQKVENPDNIHEELSEFFERERLKREMIVSCLPAAYSFIREISVPFYSPKKLRQILKYQVEPCIPYPIEDMVVDYLPSRRGAPVLAAAAPKKILSEHIKTFSMAHLDPKVVSVDSIALFFLYLHTHKWEPGSPVAIIHFARDSTSILIMDGPSLEFIRVLPGKTKGIKDIVETFGLYRFKMKDVPVTEILLTGRLCGGENAVERLQSAVNIKTSIWRPFDAIDHNQGDISPRQQAELSVPLGLAICPVVSPTKPFDLRREEFRSDKTLIDPKRASTVGIYIFLILGFLGFNLYYKVNVQERVYNQLRRQTKQVFLHAFPQTKTIVKGRELTQMKQKIDEEMGKYQWLEESTEKASTLDILMILSRSIPNSLDVKVDNILIEGNEIRLDGNASSFETVDNLEKALKGEGRFKTVKLVSAKIDQKGKGVKFNFAIEKD